MRVWYVGFILGFGLLWCSGRLVAAEDSAASNRLSNPTFQVRDGQKVPWDWSIWRPSWTPAACEVRCQPDGVLVRSSGRPHAVGGLMQTVEDIRPGQAYRLEADGILDKIASPYQSILLRITWLRDRRTLHPAGMLVRGPYVADDGAGFHFDDVLVAPEGANRAEISLEVKWPRAGSILWRQVAMRACEPPGPRKVKIGTVYLRPRSSTPEKNLDLFCAQVDEAGRLGLDIVCLGETIRQVGTRATMEELAEPIPGPASERLGQAARRNRLWVVVSLRERSGQDVYNTGVLFDRAGRIAGTYRKVHLPREEWKQGVTPGDSYPVFRTDFGTVAIQICYDWFFPEPECIFALKGAEIIFAPTWGNTLPDVDGCVDGETTFRVRARDNGVYMVASVYDGNSLVIDPRGRILATSAGKEGVFWAEVDLNRRETLDWVGYWRSIGPRHRLIESYPPLLGYPQETNPQPLEAP
ncbi:MAG: carbon-nitrogen hydrolase family protein [Sedimentisphaerales bacterium]|nr:carbon-nitrogen hydrolase family protein [Sedimentisphaerales bacterium]